jgi:hypothetical protein
LVDGKKNECRMDIYNNFERMEVNRDSLGRLKFQKNLTNPLGFGGITSY